MKTFRNKFISILFSFFIISTLFLFYEVLNPQSIIKSASSTPCPSYVYQHDGTTVLGTLVSGSGCVGVTYRNSSGNLATLTQNDCSAIDTVPMWFKDSSCSQTPMAGNSGSKYVKDGAGRYYEFTSTSNNCYDAYSRMNTVGECSSSYDICPNGGTASLSRVSDPNLKCGGNGACVIRPLCEPTPTPSPTPRFTPTPIATLTPISYLPADIDHNGCVGIADFNAWLYRIQRNVIQANTYPDVNKDRSFDLVDYNLWYQAQLTLPANQLCPTQ